MKTISLKFAGCAALLALGLNAGAAINTQEDFNAAVAAAKVGDVIELESNGDSYKIPGIPVNITIKAADGVVYNCEGSGSICSIPHGCTFEGGTFNMGNSSYHGWQHAGYIVMKGCTINGLFFSYSDMKFDTCTFVQTASEYCMWTYAGDLDYINCTVSCNGKFLNVYREGADPYTVNVVGCKISSSKLNKAALNVKATCVNGNILSYTVNVSDCEILTPDKFPAPAPIAKHSGDKLSLLVIDGLIQVDDIDETHQPDKTTVYLNGKPVYPEPEAKEIEIKPVVVNADKGITQDIADEINNNTEVKKIVESGVNAALANIDPEGEAVVKVVLTGAKKENDPADTPTLTFEVAPYVGDTKVMDVNEKLNGKKVTVVLPLTKDFTISAIVTHEGDPDRLLPVLGVPNNPYVRLETTHFSEFTATPNSQKVSSTEVDAKTVLGIKRVKEMAKGVDTAAAVPWLGAAGGDCKVSELIATGLAMGDTIKVYDLAAKDYFTWFVDTDGKTWKKVAGASESQPEAGDYTLARGRAFWYMKAGTNPFQEYTQVGTYSTDQILTSIDKGASFAAPVHNLLINPKWVDFSIQEKLTAAAGCKKNDSVVIVATGARYYFAGEAWGQYVEVTKTDRRGREVTTTELRPIGDESGKVGDGLVPAGTAFWYLSAGGSPTIAW